MISVKALKLINLSREVAHELMAAEAGVDLTFDEFNEAQCAMDFYYRTHPIERRRQDFDTFLRAIAKSRSQKAS